MGIFFVLGLFACKSKTEKMNENLTEFFRDSVFLNIEGGNLDNLFMEGRVNHKIYYQAVRRLNRGVSVQGDTLYWSIKNGAEVKVSENIYDYITFVWKLGNKNLRTDKNYEIRKGIEDGVYFVTRKDASEKIGVKIH